MINNFEDVLDGVDLKKNMKGINAEQIIEDRDSDEDENESYDESEDESYDKVPTCFIRSSSG